MLATVEEVEVLVQGLANFTPVSGPSSEAHCVGFLFDPPPRQEPSATGGEWVVVGSRSAFKGQVSDLQRAQYTEAELRFAELVPMAERMRRRYKARAELEEVKAKVREFLPGTPEDALVAAQILIESGNNAAAAALRPLLDRALELGGAAVYGPKTAERALDLLARVDAARALFDTDVVPRLAAAVAAAAADDAECRAAAEVDAAMDEARRAREERSSAELAQTCAVAARVSVPRHAFNMFS